MKICLAVISSPRVCFVGLIILRTILTLCVNDLFCFCVNFHLIYGLCYI